MKWKVVSITTAVFILVTFSWATYDYMNRFSSACGDFQETILEDKLGINLSSKDVVVTRKESEEPIGMGSDYVKYDPVQEQEIAFEYNGEQYLSRCRIGQEGNNISWVFISHKLFEKAEHGWELIDEQ